MNERAQEIDDGTTGCFLGGNMDEKAKTKRSNRRRNDWKKFASDRAHAAFFSFLYQIKLL